ncbi:NAD(P)/FAD-dependent oxidoreductase [Sediminibacterium ginsengisoli]|uniref:Glycine/D-amino acid oxidase n=1 Tax=Sediminibacterium ginsengisoli TaxID=413434 RepID=A0A1T4PLJ9_9BACT|nr:FAD-binding oxidoreductase [Sediminibacterium ginsengisoli]SJZ92445.1 Glycine/D-amino acid oxidase [Sediminibacterium ginsengisoli]
MHHLSIWEKETYYSPQDIIIAGGGLMGLWTAFELKKRNNALRISVVERNPVPLGASSRNAGFACFGSPTELIHNMRSMGKDAMLEVVEMRYKGIEKIRSFFKDDEIAFDPCGGFECIDHTYDSWHELPGLLDELNDALKPVTGISQVFSYANDQIQEKGLRNFDAMISNPLEAGLHSGMLLQGLSRLVQSMGVQLYYGLEVTGWDEGEPVTVHTSQFNMQAGRLLLCCNAFTKDLFPASGVVPARGQVIVTSPVPGLTMKGTFHYDEGFYYWRNLGNRILLGGARNTAIDAERTTGFEGSGEIRIRLEQFLREHLSPRYSYTIDHHWSGIMGFTDNGMPLLEAAGEKTDAVSACNGMGVALTPVFAEKVAQHLLRYF